jgi:predicted nucleic acid-binding protein
MRLSLLDTTLLSNFAHAGRPDLLRLVLGETAVTTPTVLAELRQGEATGFVPAADWTWLPQTTLRAAEEALAADYLAIVDAGEAECLAVAVGRNGRFLSDDLTARRLAEALSVPFSGTIGVLLRLIHHHAITVAAADALLDRMRLAGYRAPAKSLRQCLEEP